MSLHRLFRKRQRGVTLVEALASIGIFSAAMVGMGQMATGYADDLTSSNSADHLKMVANAAQNYIKDNFATVTASATSTTPFLIRTSDLVGGGYLLPALASTNGYEQSTCVLALEPTANKIAALVVTEGGKSLDDVALGNVVKLAGGSAGTISSTTPTLIKGASGGWQLNVSDWHNKTNHLNQNCSGTAGAVQVTAGHLVSALWFEDGAYQNPTLYRDAVPGRPELNTMNAPIIFNSTQTVGVACSTPGALSNDSAGAMVNCTGGQWKAVGGSVFWADAVSTFAALPVCNAAAQNATRVVRTPAPGAGTTPRAYTCDGTAWQALAVDNNGNMTLPGTLTAGKLQITDVATERTACPSNGALARNTAGATLTCQGGLWTRMLAASGDVASRDGTAQCCGDPGSLALAENSITTGRKAGISFHNAGQTQGNMYLTSGDAIGKRIVFGDNEGNTMRVEANDFYIRSTGKFASQLGTGAAPQMTHYPLALSFGGAGSSGNGETSLHVYCAISSLTGGPDVIVEPASGPDAAGKRRWRYYFYGPEGRSHSIALTCWN